MYMSYVSTQLVSSAIVILQQRRNYGWDRARLASAANAADVSENMYDAHIVHVTTVWQRAVQRYDLAWTAGVFG